MLEMGTSGSEGGVAPLGAIPTPIYVLEHIRKLGRAESALADERA
jgi:hypothetical protein